MDIDLVSFWIWADLKQKYVEHLTTLSVAFVLGYNDNYERYS